MKIDKRNLIIYIVGLLISILLIGVYFVCPSNSWCIVFCSIGASGVGAVVLAFFIEWSNEKSRSEHKKIIRTAKLHIIDFRSAKLLERIVIYYFKKRNKILNISNPQECHRITYDELWNEIQKQTEYCEGLALTETVATLNRINSTDKEIRHHCENFAKCIEDRVSEMRMFEAVGYFSNNDMASVMYAGICCRDVASFEESLDVESLKSIFDSLIEVSELSYLKTTVFYYKDKKADYTSNVHKAMAKNHFSEEEIAMAISAEERFKATENA